MKKFILCMWGSGGPGCDYAIGCNMNINEFEARDVDAARKQAETWVKEMHEDGLNEDEPWYLERAVLATAPEELPIEAWYDEIRHETESMAAKEREEQERKEFERLKKLYGE